MISTSSMSGNSISLDAATMTAMAANKQYTAANAAMMSNILIMVDPPFRSLIQTLDLLPFELFYCQSLCCGLFASLTSTGALNN